MIKTMNNQNTIKPLNPSDLMIGNLVLDSTKNTTVVENIVNGDNRVRYGIPLTEEWLLIFGFGQKYTSDPQEQGASQAFFIGEFVLHNTAEDNYSGFYFYSYTGLSLEVKTVHQLQNLYYLLTGEKLKGGK